MRPIPVLPAVAAAHVVAAEVAVAVHDEAVTGVGAARIAAAPAVADVQEVAEDHAVTKTVQCRTLTGKNVPTGIADFSVGGYCESICHVIRTESILVVACAITGLQKEKGL